MHQASPLLIFFLYILRYDKYITVALKVETDISASIKANQKGPSERQSYDTDDNVCQDLQN